MGKKSTKLTKLKSLGLIIDKHLSWSRHIDSKSKKISSAIGALKRIRPFVSMNTATQLYQALIQPHFDYCSSALDVSNATLSDKLQKLQNRAVRVITRSNCDTNAKSVLDRLSWDDLSTRRKKLKAVLMFLTIKGPAPPYLQNLYTFRNTNYNMRNAENKLNLPKPRTNYLKCSSNYTGALLWNNLPHNLRTIDSLRQFKKAIDRNYNG